MEIRDDKKSNFSIVYPDRVFQIKADSLEQKETWMNALEFLRNYKKDEKEEAKLPENIQTTTEVSERKSSVSSKSGDLYEEFRDFY